MFRAGKLSISIGKNLGAKLKKYDRGFEGDDFDSLRTPKLGEVKLLKLKEKNHCEGNNIA